MHRILERQLKRHLGTAEVGTFTPELRAFIQAVEVTYGHFDEDKILAERSLELSSKELNEANSALLSTLGSTADGILVVNNDGKIVLFNKRFVDLWGIPQDILDSRDDNKAIAFVLSQLSEPDAFLRKVKSLYGSNEVSFDELKFKDGRIFERYSQPQVVNNVQVARVWSFRDVTERVKSEELVRMRAEELEKMNALMIGRELKMVELKDELAKLKGEAPFEQ